MTNNNALTTHERTVLSDIFCNYPDPAMDVWPSDAATLIAKGFVKMSSGCGLTLTDVGYTLAVELHGTRRPE